jgi:zinc finger BED domain-containing protein 4
MNIKMKSSLVWEFFTVCEEEPHLAVCSLCHKKISRGAPSKPQAYSTSSMTSHLRSKHPKEYLDGEKRKNECSNRHQFSPSTSTLPAKLKQKTLEMCFSETQPWPIDHPSAVRVHFAIGSMIAKDIQPLQMVENQGFRELLQILEPHYQVPSRRYFTDNVLPRLLRI